MRFINRRVELKRLSQQLALFRRGEWDNTCHLALLGLRRTGKTFLLKHFLDHLVDHDAMHTAYLDVSKIANSPRDFARSMVLAALQSATGSRSEELLDLALQTEHQELIRAIDRFQRVTLESADNVTLFNAAF
ncbi:MAG: ATP-binding protein, partial [Verrucomicrobia bacterium]|nr:ATP-binding protein [Verrucomicrobiota bacterium]